MSECICGSSNVCSECLKTLAAPIKSKYVNLGRSNKEKEIIDRRVELDSINKKIDVLIQDLFQLKARISSLGEK